ncbi:MAG: glycogen/starch synthase, partial [Candidatus Kapaibacteriota bacterium]
MIILLASAELDHFAKVGGLADISAALPRGWADLGHEPIVIIPKYQCITDSIEIHSTNIEFTICNLSVRVFKSHLPESTISVYLLECDELYDRPGIYG